MNVEKKDEFLRNQSILYRNEITQVLDFWEHYGYDSEYGGFFTSLDQNGTIFSTYKSVWAQGRGLYIYAYAYKYIEPRKEWLAIAKHTFDFMINHCFDSDNHMYFLVTKDGKPIQKRRYWFSSAFMAMGSIMMYSITKEKQYLHAAIDSYNTITSYYYKKKYFEPKYNSEVINTISLADVMILLNTAQQMRIYDSSRQNNYQKDIDAAIHTIITKHYHKESKALFEHVQENGLMFEESIGQIINPGHSFECAWFLLDEYRYNNCVNQDLLDAIINITNWSYEKGWDKQHSGFLYLVNNKNLPLEKLEWDMKLWWPHTEALILYLKLYFTTKNISFLNQYKKIFEYTITNFKKDNFEWLGYLHRDNSPSQMLKGNTFKGPFHIPRMLMFNFQMMEEYLRNGVNNGTRSLS